MPSSFRSLEIGKEVAILDAMKVIGSSPAQISLVTEEDGRLLGTLTDGDIRRGILKGFSLEEPVKKVMNCEFSYVAESTKKEKIIGLMKQKCIRQMPVLDKDGHIVELVLLDDYVVRATRGVPVVIMAGGKGTRLLPLTEDCPKPMICINGKPMLEIILEQFIDDGFSDFYFSVNYLKEQIIDHFGAGEKWGVSINYLEESRPLGTAGSLKLLPDKIFTPFVVINGDLLTRLDLRKMLQFHEDFGAVATVGVREHRTKIPFGVVKADGVFIEEFREKPVYSDWVNAGVYILEPTVLQDIDADKYVDMPNLLEEGIKRGKRIAACPIHEYWIDVGRPETLEQAYTEWKK